MAESQFDYDDRDCENEYSFRVSLHVVLWLFLTNIPLR